MLSNKEIVCPENLLKVAKNKKDVTVKLGPNIVHEILDSLEVEH